jgi:hypothetical protein
MLPPYSMSKSFIITSNGTAHFSETSVDFYHTTRRDIPDDGSIHVKIHSTTTNMLSFWQHEPAAYHHCHSVSSYCPCHLAEIQKTALGLLLSEQRQFLTDVSGQPVGLIRRVQESRRQIRGRSYGRTKLYTHIHSLVSNFPTKVLGVITRSL